MRKFNYFENAKKPQEAIDEQKDKEASNAIVLIDKSMAESHSEVFDNPPK